jgi:amino-acid N-acetyltransferase
VQHARLDRLQSEDKAAVLRLLSDNGLPTDGLIDHLETVLVARLNDRVVACAALEVYADAALLRSVAVEEALRGSGLGHQIVRAALDLARQQGSTSVYLLTTTAEGFFPRFGFRQVVRADVPPSVQKSVEFQSACPASAVVMATDLMNPRLT